MDSAVNLIFEFGQFIMPVIAVCVAVILFISIVDRHPRDGNTGDDQDHK